jgi:polysaccharide export outer membrane protein
MTQEQPSPYRGFCLGKTMFALQVASETKHWRRRNGGKMRRFTSRSRARLGKVLTNSYCIAVARKVSLLVLAVALVPLAGCTSNGVAPPERDHNLISHEPAAEAIGAPTDQDAKAMSSIVNTKDELRLEELWQERTSDATLNEDYSVGPGDVLSISVPTASEIQDRKVRVTAAGTIELPLLGLVHVAGLTEDQVADSLNQKLTYYLYNPQTSVFVDEYHNRAVAVVGAVNTPGLVQLNSPSETLLDVVTQAGGLSSLAADEIILIPGEQANPGLAKEVSWVALDDSGPGRPAMDAAGGDSRQASSQLLKDSNPFGVDSSNLHVKLSQNGSAATALNMAPKNARPVSIRLKSNSLTGAGHYVNLPMRPGDVIVVPGGGNVMVVGWVQRPGYFPVGSGLTVLGALGQAGGPMYAAKTANVTLIRSGKDGEKTTLNLNLDKITKGESPDVPVKGNDVIDVPYSDLRIGPYIFYSILTRVSVGAATIPY